MYICVYKTAISSPTLCPGTLTYVLVLSACFVQKLEKEKQPDTKTVNMANVDMTTMAKLNFTIPSIVATSSIAPTGKLSACLSAC